MAFDARMVLRLYGAKDAVRALMRWRNMSQKEAEDAVRAAGGKLD